jgi:hypothetical protein
MWDDNGNLLVGTIFVKEDDDISHELGHFRDAYEKPSEFRTETAACDNPLAAGCRQDIADKFAEQMEKELAAGEAEGKEKGDGESDPDSDDEKEGEDVKDSIWVDDYAWIPECHVCPKD